jgi:hypothetical protein
LEGGGWDGVSFAIGVRLELMDFNNRGSCMGTVG